MALKGMDGRINIPVATSTPPDIIQPFRNLGGMFNLGWPHLNEVLAHHVGHTVRAGRQTLVLITYHFSKGDPSRGCAGFNYDTQAAIAHTEAIKSQVEDVFGHGHGTVYPVVCGFETDEDALILHGRDGARLNLAEMGPEQGDSLLPLRRGGHGPGPGQAEGPLHVGIHRRADPPGVPRPGAEDAHAYRGAQLAIPRPGTRGPLSRRA